METLVIETGRRVQMLNITSRVAGALAGSQARAALVFCPHTTAALTINENADPDVPADILLALERISPVLPAFRHREGNSDAHVKASLLGASVIVPLAEGKPALGVWQGIWFCEFDGPRRRSVWITEL